MSGLNILHIEDDARTAETVAAAMTKAGDKVIWAADGTTGLHLAAGTRFDLVILDRMLPDMSGIDLVSKLRDVGVDVPVLMLSALGRTENRIEGLDAGVDDYLAKPFEHEELIARVRALHRRANGQSHSAVIIFGDMECHIKARTAHRQGKHVALSPKEFELFKYFMQNAGDIVTREMLLHNVWNLNFDPQTNVIDVNVGRLRRKLEEGFDKPVLETIWGAGYRLHAV